MAIHRRLAPLAIISSTASRIGPRLVLFCLAASASLAWPQTKPAPRRPRSPSGYLPDLFAADARPGVYRYGFRSNQPWAISDTTVNEDDMNPKLAPEAILQPPEDNPRAFQEAVTTTTSARRNGWY